MRASFVALAIATTVVVAATAVLTGARVTQGGEISLLDTGAASYDANVTSFDGTSIALTIYRPTGASASAPVPVVLHSHGWSGSRTTDGAGIVGKLWDAGFGVVSIDARGHGASGGFATVHHKDAEVKDFQAVLDWIHDELDWVEREDSGIEKDIVAGGAGYSYAGGFQLMTSSHDARLDAIAPEITWSDLVRSLAPEGVLKSLWVDFLVATARESGTRVDPRIEEWYQAALVTNTLPPAALEHLRGSSPDLRAIQADVLLIQGVPDVLFNLNEAVRTYHALQARPEIDVRLFTHLTGHVAPFAQPFGTSFDRRGIFEDEGPCGTVSDLVVLWLDEKLRDGPASGIPEVSFALDDGGCVALDAYPAHTTDARAALAAAPSALGSTLVPLLDGPALVAGVPTLRATLEGGTGGVAFAGLVIAGADGFTRVVDDQSTPFLASGTFEIPLAGVAARLGSGDRLLLRIDGLNEWYAHNGARLPGASVLRDITVTLPLVDE